MTKKNSSLFSKLLFRGLGLVLPLALTIALLVWLWNLIVNQVLNRATQLLNWTVDLCGFAPLAPATTLALSAILVLGGLLLLGFWFSGFVGRKIYSFFERALAKVPLIGAIYPYVKQITEFFFGEEKKVEFKRVVSIPYPRQGLYSLAFLTGSSAKALNDASGEELISVFVPSSPMPATGYTLFVPAEDIIEMPLTVEEALRTIVSGGVLLPPHAADPSVKYKGKGQ